MINVQNNPVFSSHFKITKKRKKKEKKNFVSVVGIIVQIIGGDGFEISELDGAFIIQQG